MKKEYDFSKAEQGKFYRPVEKLEIPIYGRARTSTGSDLTIDYWKHRKRKPDCSINNP
ncbi:MAG: hypothetical protein WA126_00355 [Thermodesulfovibrionales bacterium]